MFRIGTSERVWVDKREEKERKRRAEGGGGRKVREERGERELRAGKRTKGGHPCLVI